MKKILGLVSLLGLLAACNAQDAKNYTQEYNEPSDNYQQSNNYQSSDSWITTKVKSAIMNDSSLSGRTRYIYVETTNGVVTLSGSVPTRDDSRNAERIARNVEGVHSVKNQLTIGK